jgi:hypothetical protein
MKHFVLALFFASLNLSLLAVVPAAPSNLVATVVSYSRIDLTWTDNSTNETGFIIARKTGSGGTYEAVGGVLANVTSYQNTGLNSHTIYYYYVVAYNSSGSSSPSNEVHATTLYGPPVAPSNLGAIVISASQINLSWTDNSSFETGVKIERKTGSTGTWAQIATVAANVTTYNNTGLSQHTIYYYRVRAYYSTYNSSYSNEDYATTEIAAPGNLTATAVSISQINLHWTDNSNDEDGFGIQRKNGIFGTYEFITIVAANATSYQNTGLSQGTKYYYRVCAYIGTTTSDFSNEANETTFAVPPPAAPSGLTAVAVSPNQINLAWTDNSNDETGFIVERKPGTGGTWTEIVIVGANTTTYNNSGINPNITYYYRVRAYNTGGYSAYSNEAIDSPSPVWARVKKVGGVSNECVLDMAVDDQGNQYITGYFQSSVYFGSVQLSCSGFTDIFVAKLSPTGNCLWAVRAGGNGGYGDYGYGIDVDNSGNVYVTGVFVSGASFGSTILSNSGEVTNDIFVAKLGNTGNWLWAVKAGGEDNDFGSKIAHDNAGNVYLTGYFISTATFGSTTLDNDGYEEIFVAKLDSNGTWLWAIKVGSSNSSEGVSICIFEDNPVLKLYLTGYFLGNATFGAQTLNSVYRTVFVACLTGTGSWEWAVQAVGTNTNYGNDICIDGSQNIYVTGNFKGTANFGTNTVISNGSDDIYIAKLNSSAVWQWAVSAGGAIDDNSLGVALDSDANVYITGRFRGSATFGSETLISSGDKDIFVAKLEPGGSWLWALRAGGVGEDLSNEICPANDGSIYLAGVVSGTAGFGDITLVSAGPSDLFVAKLDTSAGSGVPLAPQNITIVRNGYYSILTWDPVILDTQGYPLTPDFYRIYYSSSPNGTFYLMTDHVNTNSWTYSTYSSKVFYRVVAVYN